MEGTAMMRPYEEILAIYKEEFRSELESCLKHEKTPSYCAMFLRGYTSGQSDARNGKLQPIDESKIWHYVELEGNPANDDRMICLIQCNKYKGIREGYFEEGRWHLDWYGGNGIETVVAWHRIPVIPE